MAASHQGDDVTEITYPIDNVKIANYRKRRNFPGGYALEPIANIAKGIKDENGREPEIPRYTTRLTHLDNVTDRPLSLSTAPEFPVESILSRLSKNYGRITVTHVYNYKRDGTPTENTENGEPFVAHAFDFSPPPAYQISA